MKLPPIAAVRPRKGHKVYRLLFPGRGILFWEEQAPSHSLLVTIPEHVEPSAPWVPDTARWCREEREHSQAEKPFPAAAAKQIPVRVASPPPGSHSFLPAVFCRTQVSRTLK